MKKKNSVSDYVPLRNSEIKAAFRKTMANSPLSAAEEFYQRVADCPCSRFWVSEERAAFVVSKILGGCGCPCVTPTKKEMFDEILRRVSELRNSGDERPLSRVVAEVVNSPAPKFYMTWKTIRQNIYKSFSRNGKG